MYNSKKVDFFRCRIDVCHVLRFSPLPIMTIIIISLILFFIYVLLMLMYSMGWHRQALYTGIAQTPRTTVTVIIPARNEAQNIGPCLQSILDNDFPPELLEIIVIDDFSTDGTATIANNLLKDRNGCALRLEQYLSKDERLNSYKKKALEIAIGEARGELIITTDADCTVPGHWLKKIVGLYEQEQAVFIAAPVSFSPGNARGAKDTLYYFQSLDFMTMQGITAASVKMNLGNMCNGANLAFSKAAFEQVGGYKGIDHIASGDDMLLMHKMQQQFPNRISYLKSEAAIVTTAAQPGWRDFLNQRIRWSSKADKYDDKKLTLILVFIYLFNLSFIVLIIAGFFHIYYWLWLLGILFAKTAIELVFLVPVARFYGKLRELLYFPLLQPLHILYIIAAGFLGKFGSYQWKGRTVK